MTKRCSRCGRSRPLEAFGADRSRSDGLTRYCRDCRSRKIARIAPSATHQDVPLTRGRTLRVALHDGEARRLVLSVMRSDGRAIDSAIVLPSSALHELRGALAKLNDTHRAVEVTRGDNTPSE